MNTRTQPQRSLGPCMIRIIVYEGTDPKNPGRIVHDKTNDYNEAFFRDWIFDTEWWALRNAHTVVKYPV